MSKFSPQLSPAAELAHHLLASDDLYPWNPADPEAENYYLLQEEQFCLDDWSEIDLQSSATSFFTQLGSCWPDSSIDLVAYLQQHFTARIPQHWLEKIADTVQTASQRATANASQLVSCVQEVLPSWQEADLLVLARPYNYAMRCELDPENANNLVRAVDWSELSEMEQAKLTMLATKYALDQLADKSQN